LNFWSRLPMPESRRIGYAPLESRTKPWAIESPIEGWFPHESGELNGCKVIREVSYRLETENQNRENQPVVRLFKTDAGCQTRSTQRAGEVCLDSLPHRRHFKRIPPLVPNASTILPPNECLINIVNRKHTTWSLKFETPTEDLIRTLKLCCK